MLPAQLTSIIDDLDITRSSCFSSIELFLTFMTANGAFAGPRTNETMRHLRDALR
jgi:hypothetical protein